MTPNQSDTFHQGTRRVLAIEAAPKTHTGSTFAWTLTTGGPDGTVVLAKTLGSGVWVSGTVVSVQLDPAETALLRGTYWHEMVETDADGAVAVLCSGWLTVLGSTL